MEATVCRLCGIIWLNERPFVCECKSNCFMVDYETTQEEIDLIKKEHKEVIIRGE